MELHHLRPQPGSGKSRKRVGRGPGSGHGKTSGRGHKGRKARTGGSTPPGYEGGQMPLVRRLPKRGFTHVFKEIIQVINLEDLKRFDPGAVVDPDVLRKEGMLKGRGRKVKVLGDGTLDKPLTVRAHGFSLSARNKIEALGGKAEVI